MLKFINAACAFQKQKNTSGKQESLVCSSLFLLKSIFVLSSSGVNNFNEKEKIARWSLSSGIYRLRWFLEIQKTGEQSSKSPGEIVYNPLKSIFFKSPNLLSSCKLADLVQPGPTASQPSEQGWRTGGEV